MRRTAGPRTITVILAFLIGLLATACVGSAPREPTLPSINFAPKLVIELRDNKLNFTRGPREDPEVNTDPPSAPGGSVMEVANLDGRDHRLQAGSTFDTGTIRPGERTMIVLVNDTTDDKVVEIADAADPANKATLTIKPRAH